MNQIVFCLHGNLDSIFQDKNIIWRTCLVDKIRGKKPTCIPGIMQFIVVFWVQRKQLLKVYREMVTSKQAEYDHVEAEYDHVVAMQQCL